MNWKKLLLVATPLFLTLTSSGIAQEEDMERRRPCCIVPPSGMVGWWSLDEVSGTSSADLALPAQNGTHVGGPSALPSGKVAGALMFNGSNYVEVADHNDLDFGRGDFSVDAWILLRSTERGVRTFIDKRDQGVTGYGAFLYNGQLSLQLADGPTHTNFVSNATVPPGQWQHIAITVDRDDPAGIKFYLNGQPAGTANPTVRPGSLDNAAPLRIGGHSWDPATQLRGGLDEVELFNRVLYPSEVEALFRADRAGKCKPECEDLQTKFHSDSTGWMVTAAPSGAALTLPVQPVIVQSPTPAWVTTGTGPWISASAASGGISGLPGLYVYEYTFCLCEGFGNARLGIRIRADNGAKVSLNGNSPQTIPVNNFNAASPATVTFTQADFIPGPNNVLRVEVTNQGSYTGFALSADLRARAGLCP